MKGRGLLRAINAVRLCQGRFPINRIALAETLADDPVRCPVAAATGVVVTSSTAADGTERFVMRFSTAIVARTVAEELGQKLARDRREVIVPDPMVSLIVAVHYGLVFDDGEGFLRGWIEPTDANNAVWDLHLMPGHDYPKGHDPWEASDLPVSRRAGGCI